MTLIRVPLDQLRGPPNVPAGMNPLLLMSIAYQLRTSDISHDVDPPILIDWDRRIIDGRHRWMASYIAGRNDVLCQTPTPSAGSSCLVNKGDGGRSGTPPVVGDPPPGGHLGTPPTLLEGRGEG